MSLICVTCVLLDRRSPLRCKNTNGGRCDAHDLRCLLGGVIEEVDQHDALPLPRGEHSQGSNHCVTRLDVSEGISARANTDRTPDRDRCATHPLAMEVQRRSIEVARRTLHLLHSIPALPHLQEGLLHHVLGFAAIPDDQAEGAIEAGVRRVHEVLEVDQGGSGGLLGSLRSLERRVGREAKLFVHPDT